MVIRGTWLAISFNICFVGTCAFTWYKWGAPQRDSQGTSPGRGSPHTEKTPGQVPQNTAQLRKDTVQARQVEQKPHSGPKQTMYRSVPPDTRARPIRERKELNLTSEQDRLRLKHQGHFGNVLDMFCTCAGQVCDMFGACLKPVWDMRCDMFGMYF